MIGTMEQSNDYFANRVKEYSVSYLREDEEVLIDKYFTKKNGRVLVLGCGAGRTLVPLHEKGYEVVAMDIVPEMVAKAREVVGDRPIEVLEMDATDLDFPPQSFDYVIFPFHGLDCVPNMDAAIEEAARVLKDDGVFISNSHNRWYLKDLKRAFDGGWAEYDGLLLYRSTPFDTARYEQYFEEVTYAWRISLLKQRINWKDRVYQVFPFLNKSMYFISSKPKR